MKKEIQLEWNVFKWVKQTNSYETMKHKIQYLSMNSNVL